MHPPKIQTFDVPAGVNIDNKGFRREVAEYRETPFGLYMSRAIVGRASAYWIESWLLPELGLCVSDWSWNPGHHRDQDYYLDIALIEPAPGGVWRLTDLYLDIVVGTGRSSRVLDVDEFVEAVGAGLIDAAAAEYAMHRTHETVAALAAHGHDLDAWLDTEGIALTWSGAPGSGIRPAG
jgi:predicted RNA-binding protein associated with RNAse of E/G family